MLSGVLHTVQCVWCLHSAKKIATRHGHPSGFCLGGSGTKSSALRKISKDSAASGEGSPFRQAAMQRSRFLVGAHHLPHAGDGYILKLDLLQAVGACVRRM